MTPQFFNTAYGITNALQNVFPAPVVANRAPLTSDTGYQVGTIWVYKAINAAWILTSVASASATWEAITGAGGAFTSLTVTPGPISLTGTTTINTTGAATTSIGSTTGASGITDLVGTGNYSLDGVGASTYTIGTSTTTGTIAIGGTAQTGAITLGSSSGTNIVNLGTGTGATTVNVATGATNAKAVNITTGAVANTVIIGSTTGAATTTIRSGSGNINMAGTFALSSTGPQILFGAGAPSATVPKGSLYINTSATTTTTRFYIATDAAGTWTNFTTAA